MTSQPSQPARPRRRSTASAWLLLSIALGLGPAAELAADPQRILLRDGSEIVAEVRSLEKGVYTFESPTLGRIRVPATRVKKIEGPPTRPTAPPPSAAAIQDLQTRMLTDPQLSAALMQLQSNPAMQEVLQDPEILRAVARRDMEFLQRHPKMKRLMKDPAVRALTGGVAPGAAPSPPGSKPSR